MKCILFCVFVSLLVAVNAESCTTPLGARSTCVVLYDCPSMLQAFTKRPLQRSTTEYLRRSQCGFEGFKPRVCCSEIPSTVTQDSSQQNNQLEQPSQPVNTNVAPTVREDSEPAPDNACGLDPTDRIFGGTITDLDEFPWMALLGYRTRNGSLSYQCGGVLINRRYVLTAAHCITGKIERDIGRVTTVRLGEYDILTSPDCVELQGQKTCADPHQEISVQQAFPHPGFSDSNINRKDDVGIVRLAQRATLSDYVQPICLANFNARFNNQDSVYVAGWGKTRPGNNSPVKLKLQMPIFDKSSCDAKYARVNVALTDKQICAGGVFEQDACRGDSGGPLMRKKLNGDWEVLAVVSFGNGCGNDGWPGVYTSVPAQNDWILSTLRSSNV